MLAIINIVTTTPTTYITGQELLLWTIILKECIQ